jgi:uncharacterized protein GlcG (DUF336 family)
MTPHSRPARSRTVATVLALVSLTATVLGTSQASTTTSTDEGAATTRALVEKRTITMDAALAIARVALEVAREKGCESAASVVDQAGIRLVTLRSDGATEQFLEGAEQKAWTALNLRASTRALLVQVESGKQDLSQLPHIPGALLLMGGVPLIVDGAIVGAVGAAGCTSGLDDDLCAQRAAEAFARMLPAEG